MTARRGEVWLVDLGLAGKVRPALVVSIGYLDHERALVTVVPHTTALRGTRFEVRVNMHGISDGAFDAQGVRPIPPTVLIRRLAVLPGAELHRVEAAVRHWLQLP